MVLDANQIKELIPQRFPFLMIDRVIELEPGKHIVALKNITGNETFFPGHFPDRPIMPGALIIEAIAQAAIVMFASEKSAVEGGKKPIYYFGSVKARFLQPVVPGDQMIIQVKTVKSLSTGAYVSGETFVEDKKISEAELVFSVKDE